MNLKNLASYILAKPQFYGHLGNSFFNVKRFNIKNTDSYFTVEQQTLFNFKIVFYIGKRYEQQTRTAYIVTSDPDDFYTKYTLTIKYFQDFPSENYIVL